jgi:hypothetical protein
MTNREILRAPGVLLSEVDRQRHFVLRVELMPAPCPASGRGLSFFDAARIDIDEYDSDSVTRHDCVCPCGAELEQIVPAFPGGQPWHWKFKDDWLRAQLAKARAYDQLPREEQA